MKKLLAVLLLMCFANVAYGIGAGTPISVDTFVSPDDVTIAHLEAQRTTLVDAINNLDGGLLTTGSITGDALAASISPITRWNEAFNDWVYTGLTIPTSGSLSSTTTAGTAYINGVRNTKAATAKTYTASRYTYVDLADDGTYTYSETSIGAGEPAVTANSIRIARVSTDGTTVAAVRDDRILSISLDSHADDFYRSGLTISVVTPDAITISPGVVYHGSKRIRKTTNTALNIATAGDYTTGGSQRSTTTMGYVCIDSDANIKLTTTAPTKHNLGGDTDGKWHYIDSNSEYWRCLAWYYMDNEGSGNIQEWAFGNFRELGAPNAIHKSTDTLTAHGGSADTPELQGDMSVKFYSTGGPLLITYATPHTGNGNGHTVMYISLDNVNTYYGKEQMNTDEEGFMNLTYIATGSIVSQGTHTIEGWWAINTGTLTTLGPGEGARVMNVQEL